MIRKFVFSIRLDDSLTHKQKVCRLYKRALLYAFDWQDDRFEYRKYAVAIRNTFEKRRSETNAAAIDKWLMLTEELLRYWRHEHPKLCKRIVSFFGKCRYALMHFDRCK